MININKWLVVFLIALLANNSIGWSQSLILKGNIKDLQTGEPLIGATIIPERTQNGAITDVDGNFQLRAEKGDLLIINFIGYQELKVKALENDALQIKLEPDNLLINEVKVIGFDNVNRLLETNGSVGLVTKKDLERGNTVSLQPVLNTIPGVRVDQSYLSDTRISIRGVGSRSPFGNRNLKFYLNEIPLTEADGFTRIEGIDVSTIGRVEVIKGPASSIYGAGLGGVINLQLDRSKYGEQSIESNSLVGSYGLWRTGTTLRIANNKLNLTTSYGYQNYDGYRDNSKDIRQFFTAFGQLNVNEKQNISFLINRTNQDSQIPGALTFEEVRENPQQAQIENVNQQAARDQTWLRLGISHEYEFSDVFSNMTSLYTTSYTLDHPLAFAYLRSFLQGFGGRTRFIFKPRMNNFSTKFVLGGEYLSNQVDASRFVNNGGEIGDITRDQERDNIQYSIFYQSETSISEKIKLDAGISLNKTRYSTFDLLRPVGDSKTTVIKDFDLNVSPRIGLTYFVSKNTTIHGSVSSGFSPPTSGEVLNVDGSVNTEVEAETGVNYEIGLRGIAFKKRLNYDLSLFYLKTEDELVPQAVTRFQSIFINAGETERKGVEFGFSYLIQVNPKSVVKSAKIFGTYTYSDFSFNTFQTFDSGGAIDNDFSGNDLTGIAPHAGNIGLDVRTGFGFYFYGTLLYNGAFPVNDANTIENDAYIIVNTKLGYQNTFKDWLKLNVSFGIDNLTNSSYTSRAVLNPRDGQTFLSPSPEISFYSGLSIGFIFK